MPDHSPILSRAEQAPGARPAPAPGGDATAGAPAPSGRRTADQVTRGVRSRSADRVLQILLLAAERDVRVGMTVTAGGVMVTGNLIGTVAYCQALADQFTTGAGGTGMDETFAEAFRGLVDEAYGIAQGDRRQPADAAAYEHSVCFVHLADARYVTPSGMLPVGRRGVLWCCRVEDITSWSLSDLSHG